MTQPVTVADLVSSLRQKSARMPYEIGAFLSLEACEALIHEPARVSLGDIAVGPDGQIAVYRSVAATDEEAARSIGEVLSHLLVAAGAGVPKTLATLAESGPTGGAWGLTRMRDELEASLVPLNRQAARRVLSRLLREASREGSVHHRIASGPPPTSDAVDADLDALLSRKRESLGPMLEPKTQDDDLSDLLLPPVPAEDPIPAHMRGPSTIPTARTPSPSSIPGAMSPVAEPRRSIFDEADAEAMSSAPPEEPFRWQLWVAMFAAVLALLAAGAVFVNRRNQAAEEQARAQAEEQKKAAPKPQRFGNLLIQAAPEGAQILLLRGTSPAVADELAVGVAHEFVAIAPGHQPARAVVPADGPWAEVEGTSQFELAIQSVANKAKSGSVKLGETLLRRDTMGKATGRFGRVRIITTPPGARVYQLIGFGTARVQNLKVDDTYDVLIYQEGFLSQKLSIKPDSWDESGGTPKLELTAQLQPAK